MRFYNIEYLWILLIIPALIAILIASAYLRRKSSDRIGVPKTLNRILSLVNPTGRLLRSILFLASLLFIILALARPQYHGGIEKIELRGGRVIVALDVSLSMLAQDFQPNRIEKAKREIFNLLSLVKAQTLGLIVFSGEAFVLCPPTIDFSAFKMFLDISNVGMISDTGTNLEDAINKSANLLLEDAAAEKAIILFTDGESFGGDAIKAAEAAAKNGIRVFAVGVGSLNGRPIPDVYSNSLKKDDGGEIVISKLNSEYLNSLAKAGNGKYYAATPGESEINDLYSEIKGLKGQEKENKFRTIYDEKYHWFLLPGILLMGASFFMPARRVFNEGI